MKFDWKILARYANILLGVWLMAAPDVLGYAGSAQTNDRIVGPLIISFATVAIWEATRSLRHVNTVLGSWLLLAPWVLGYASLPLFNSLIVGVLTVLFSLVKGKITETYGGGWSRLWRSQHRSSQ